MPDLPSGTVTFLFTDIAGSAALWERDRLTVKQPTRREPRPSLRRCRDAG
jgi:hypothetical protein